MAFANRIGSLVKSAMNSSPSVYQTIRCMSSSKLFVGGLSYNTDDYSLKEAFTSYGEVVEARVILDRETGRSRGFGFVTFTSGDEASTAMSALDGKELHGRVVRVNFATERTGGFRGGNYGGGSGSYGSGGGGYGSYGGGGGGYGGGGNFGGGSGGGNYASNNSGFSGYGDAGRDTYGSSAGADTFGNNSSGGGGGGGGGFGTEDDLVNEMKDADYEPNDDYANKRS